MGKRPGAVVLAAGALFALCCPGVAAAQDRPEGESLSGGGASGSWVGWAADDGEPAARGLSLGVTAPALEPSADRARFPAVRTAAEPGRGTADIELGGAARFDTPAAQPLVLAGLRLRLSGEKGTLSARTALGGKARGLTLAEVSASGADSAVRAGDWTLTGLDASLTADGAALLSSWSGTGFAAGDELGVFDVTVRADDTGDADGSSPAGTGTSQTSPNAGADTDTDTDAGMSQAVRQGGPAAAVTEDILTAGAGQTVTGTGFAPGSVVLVAIDGDTRYQAVAGADGRIQRSFPVYATALAGEHTVALTAVSGQQAVADTAYEVRTPD
ncbi:HtaA domain-containing protein [Streptomyces sp. NPDC059786]|uniref:HtaA domain-containing protein n=1 Tax=Streptomyces sp. NPDC059786 TaxID=3346946 RepID=UPI0036662C2B